MYIVNYPWHDVFHFILQVSAFIIHFFPWHLHILNTSHWYFHLLWASCLKPHVKHHVHLFEVFSIKLLSKTFTDTLILRLFFHFLFELYLVRMAHCRKECGILRNSGRSSLIPVQLTVMLLSTQNILLY